MDNLDYMGLAKDQLDFLLENIPKASDDAISHCVEEIQLWCVHYVLEGWWS